MNDEMREAFHRLLGKDGWGCEDIAFGIFETGFQAAYQLQQKRVDTLIDELELVEKGFLASNQVNKERQKEIGELKQRLEIEEGYPIDGIHCRDATIRILDERVAQLQTHLNLAVGALKHCAESIEGNEVVENIITSAGEQPIAPRPSAPDTAAMPPEGFNGF